jgi:hypothetical protein
MRRRPVYKERKSELMTERKMNIGSIPILHKFVYNINNSKSFAKPKDYQEIGIRSNNWYSRYPETPEMSLNREFDAICNRIYRMVPTVPLAMMYQMLNGIRSTTGQRITQVRKNGKKHTVASTNNANDLVPPTFKNRLG